MKPIFFLLLIIASATVSAQKFTASIDAALALPQGEYKDVDPIAGIGGRFNFLFRPNEKGPLKFGLEIGILEKGSQTQYFSGYVFGFYEEYKVTASNQIISLTIMPRLQPQKKGKLKPFIDGIIGWNVFFSSVNVEQVSYGNYPYNDNYSNSTKAHWAFTYGAAAGVDIPLNKSDDIGLELKCAFLRGADTKYLSDPQINNNGDVFFSEKQSETNMLLPQAGIRINIK